MGKRRKRRVPWDKQYKVDVPVGKVGDWLVEKFTVSKEDSSLDKMRGMFSFSFRYCHPGTFTRLKRNGSLVMSDTHDEIADCLSPIVEAERRGGHVLIHGLGLGVVLNGMLQHRNVEGLTAIEICPEVIELVGAHYQKKFGSRLEIIQADAMTWQPPKGKRFTVVWHDIWSTMCGDNLLAMHTLHRRYGSRCDWQGSWSRAWLEAHRERWDW